MYFLLAISRTFSPNARGPRSVDCAFKILPFDISQNSNDKPPISHMRPCALGQPNSTPLPAYSASCFPVSTLKLIPVSSIKLFKKLAPSLACLTAAVATPTVKFIFILIMR